ncbi:UDP-N-acetylglucosamine 2-epimerase [Vibrio variabilis]|uniref:UDP-N-acetylglucosamine 2-epimerase n=1 Tax=Vibrio variabilis TaxID=990271 RepID=A0ABQ0JFI3_9VIBR|nr:UDP-N-acetylglucosamine 2-epimerase [Vibrio variabilis]
MDELIRHAVSKLSHFHLVSNQEAKTRLIQLGEYKENIFEIGSPDIDLMNPSTLPDIEEVKQYYDIPFQRYSVAMFHPVTTEYDNMRNYAEQFVSALIESEKNYIVIYPKQ